MRRPRRALRWLGFVLAALPGVALAQGATGPMAITRRDGRSIKLVPTHGVLVNAQRARTQEFTNRAERPSRRDPLSPYYVNPPRSSLGTNGY